VIGVRASPTCLMEAGPSARDGRRPTPNTAVEIGPHRGAGGVRCRA
jgi:hypothetical protein